MKDKIETIKKLSKDIKLLYVEDNTGLRDNMEKLLAKMFNNVIIAHNGEDGYKKFVEFEPKIVITDINMPIMNGFDMLKKFQGLDLEYKAIILSAYDEKKHLHVAIDLGVFRYLSKPAQVPTLVDAMHDTVLSIHKDENRRIFLNQLQNIFNYQNNMVVMMFEGEFILPNQRFLDFFGVENLTYFKEEYNLDNLLLPHQEFLYTSDVEPWYETAVKNQGVLFHTKVKNYEGEMRHLILKLRDVPEKEGHSILSFDDVTELNLMAIFDSESAKNDTLSKDKKAVISLMQIVKDNAAEVKIHNFYKGLTIINPGVITEITDDSITLKTVNSQLKIVHLTKFTTISSDIFPQSVVCKSISQIDNEKQTITIDDMHFSPRTATDRKYIRLEVGVGQTCSLFYKQIKFTSETTIIDISEVSAKVEINALPAGMAVGEKLDLSINIKLHNKITSLTTEGTVYRIDENKRSYYLVLIFELEIHEEELIKGYMVNRQMELIREFKKLNITE